MFRYEKIAPQKTQETKKLNNEIRTIVNEKEPIMNFVNKEYSTEIKRTIAVINFIPEKLRDN